MASGSDSVCGQGSGVHEGLPQRHRGVLAGARYLGSVVKLGVDDLRRSVVEHGYRPQGLGTPPFHPEVWGERSTRLLRRFLLQARHLAAGRSLAK